MTKTKKKKSYLKERKKRRWIDVFRKRLASEGKKLGFKTGEEYYLWLALKKEGIIAKHNVKLLGTEVDLLIEPNLVVEIGFLDAYVQKKFEVLKEQGYTVLYFANLEVYDREILAHTIDAIKKALLKRIYL